MELVQPKHIHLNRFSILPDVWWMPYSETAIQTFKALAKYFTTGSLLKAALALPYIFRRLKELMRK
jgi:hypothetical protein